MAGAESTGNTVSSITWNGTENLTLDGGAVATQGANRMEGWYLANPTTGTHDIVATWTNSVNTCTHGAISLAGAAQNAPEASNSSTCASCSTINTIITTIAANAFAIDGVSNGNSQTHTHGTGEIEYYDNSGGGSQSGSGAYEDKGTAGSESMTINPSASTNRLAHVVVSIAPAGVVAARRMFVS